MHPRIPVAALALSSSVGWAVVMVACRSDAPRVRKDSPAPSATPSAAPPRAFVIRMLAAEQAEPWGIAVDATHVYWTNKGKARGQVMRLAKAGGTPQAIAGDQANPWGLWVTGDSVYWTNASPKGGSVGVWRKGEAPGAWSLLAHAPSDAWGIVGDAGHVFFSALHGKSVHWADPKGGSMLGGGPGPVPMDAAPPSVTFEVATGVGSPTALAIDTDALYVADGDGGRLLRLPHATSWKPAATIVAGAMRPASIAVDADWIYWTEWMSGKIGRADKRDGSKKQVIVGGLEGPRGLAVDATHVWFTAGTSVGRAPKGGGMPQYVTKEMGHAYAIAVDERAAYWVDAQHGVVMSVDK